MGTALGVQVPVIACDDAPWQSDIEEASERFKIDVVWIRAVMHAESDACEQLDGRLTTSEAGAMGLMQLMPATWSQYQAQLHLGADPYRPHDNIFAGAAYLRDLFDRFGLHNGLAAYAAGPQRVEEVLDRHGAIPRSVDEYVAHVLHIAQAETPLRGPVGVTEAHRAETLLAVRHVPDQRVTDRSDSQSSALFSINHLQSDAHCRERDEEPASEER
jgi:hypothetical protein